MTRNEELAYLAGIIDGEGCICLSKCRLKKSKHNAKRGFVWEPRVIVAMCDKKVMKELNKIIGRDKNIYGKWINKKRKRQIYQFTMYSNKIRELMPLIIPFLVGKKEEGKLILKAVRTLKPKSTIEADEIMELIYKRLIEIHNR